MFYLVATFFQKELQCQSIRWHFTEKGHGKGAPDGIGGAIERTADSLVGHGNDIPNIDCLVKGLRENTKINIFVIPKEDFAAYEHYVPQKLQTFKGTLKVHEVTWDQKRKAELQVRRLSCMKCAASEKCLHYSLGRIDIPGSNSSKEDKTSILFTNLGFFVFYFLFSCH